jgi:hypothetical protein
MLPLIVNLGLLFDVMWRMVAAEVVSRAVVEPGQLIVASNPISLLLPDLLHQLVILLNQGEEYPIMTSRERRRSEGALNIDQELLDSNDKHVKDSASLWRIAPAMLRQPRVRFALVALIICMALFMKFVSIDVHFGDPNDNLVFIHFHRDSVVLICLAYHRCSVAH